MEQQPSESGSFKRREVTPARFVECEEDEGERSSPGGWGVREAALGPHKSLRGAENVWLVDAGT